MSYSSLWLKEKTMNKLSICKNPNCQKSFEDKDGDGFCSDDCWAAVNCQTPEIFEDEKTLKEMLAFKDL